MRCLLLAYSQKLFTIWESLQQKLQNKTYEWKVGRNLWFLKKTCSFLKKHVNAGRNYVGIPSSESLRNMNTYSWKGPTEEHEPFRTPTKLLRLLLFINA